MTDAQGNIDDATQAARDAADNVQVTAAEGADSFGASAEEIADELSVDPAADADLAPDRYGDSDEPTGKIGEFVGGAKSAASDAAASVGSFADAAADAARAAGAKLKGVADEIDVDQIVAQTRTTAGEWTEKVKQAYRERPGVVIAAAAGIAVLAAAIARTLGRR